MNSLENNWGLPGHHWAVDLLKKQLETDRISHAILITGGKGIGKFDLALKLAQAMNCQNEDKPCLVCRSCRFISENKHVDYRLLEASGRSIKIEEIRDLIAFFSMKPFEAAHRIVLIRDFDKATGPAMDAMLKTLEEPSASSRLVLTAESEHALLPTIVSRCQILQLRPVATDLVEKTLKSRGLHPEYASLLAALSGGRISWAIEMAANPSALGERTVRMAPAMALLRMDRQEKFVLAEQITKENDDQEVSLLLANWLTFWRDVLLKIEGSDLPSLNMDLNEEIAMIAEGTTAADALATIACIKDTLRVIESTNVNKRLAIEVMLLKIPAIM